MQKTPGTKARYSGHANVMSNVTLTAHANSPHPESLVGAARWISTLQQSSARDALEVVRRIYDGEPMIVSGVLENDLYMWLDCPWFDVTVEKCRQPSAWDDMAREQASQRKLLDLALEGDANAAIEFCELYDSGQVSLHHAFG